MAVELMTRFFRQPIDDVMAGLDRLVAPHPAGGSSGESGADSAHAAGGSRSRRHGTDRVPGRGAARPPLGPMVVALIALAVTWFIYVPIHELLHVAGCHVAGGEVVRLELADRHGAAWLSRIFPFIVSGSEYAGRVTAFDTKGSDWIYLATDLGPFVLTIMLGVPMLKLAGRTRRPALFGAAVVVGLAPFSSVPGDYYEMGSIITSRIVTVLTGPPPMEETLRLASATAGADPGPSRLLPATLQSNARFAGIRADDVFTLVGHLAEKPGDLGLTSPGLIVAGVLLAIVAMTLAVLLAFATYWAGDQFAHRVLRIRRTGS